MRRRRARRRDLHAAGDGAALRRDGAAHRRDSSASRPRSSARDKFLVTLGGEHSITPPLVVGRGRASIPGCRCCRSTRTPTCATATWGRGTTTRARCAAASTTRALTQVGIRSLSTEEAEVAAGAEHDDLLRRRRCAQDPAWIDRVVESLGGPTSTSRIDVDGLDPAIMPATGTPSPAGSRGTEITRPAPRDHRRAPTRRRLRRRRAEPDPRHDGAELPLREAHLQAAHLPLRRAIRGRTRWSPTPVAALGACKLGSARESCQLARLAVT